MHPKTFHVLTLTISCKCHVDFFAKIAAISTSSSSSSSDSESTLYVGALISNDQK